MRWSSDSFDANADVSDRDSVRSDRGIRDTISIRTDLKSADLKVQQTKSPPLFLDKKTMC